MARHLAASSLMATHRVAQGGFGVGAEGEVLWILWAVPPSTRGRAPAPGVWVSRKEEKSYVYDLVYV
jgi:hypothetical protein